MRLPFSFIVSFTAKVSKVVRYFDLHCFLPRISSMENGTDFPSEQNRPSFFKVMIGSYNTELVTLDFLSSFVFHLFFLFDSIIIFQNYWLSNPEESIGPSIVCTYIFRTNRLLSVNAKTYMEVGFWEIVSQLFWIFV